MKPINQLTSMIRYSELASNLVLINARVEIENCLIQLQYFNKHKGILVSREYNMSADLGYVYAYTTKGKPARIYVSRGEITMSSFFHLLASTFGQIRLTKEIAQYIIIQLENTLLMTSQMYLHSKEYNTKEILTIIQESKKYLTEIFEDYTPGSISAVLDPFVMACDFFKEEIDKRINDSSMIILGLPSFK